MSPGLWGKDKSTSPLVHRRPSWLAQQHRPEERRPAPSTPAQWEKQQSSLGHGLKMDPGRTGRGRVGRTRRLGSEARRGDSPRASTILRSSSETAEDGLSGSICSGSGQTLPAAWWSPVPTRERFIGSEAAGPPRRGRRLCAGAAGRPLAWAVPIGDMSVGST